MFNSNVFHKAFGILMLPYAIDKNITFQLSIYDLQYYDITILCSEQLADIYLILYKFSAFITTKA